MSDLPTGTVTFLFTDIEGSTRLLQRLGDEYPGVLAEHYRLLRGSIDANGGEEVGTEGDSMFAVFPSASGALDAAVAAQRALAENPWPDGVDLRVRMGIHTGEATLGPEGYVGLDVHRAARIASAARGSQIVISASTLALIEHSLPNDINLRDLGSHRLKDLADAERLAQIVVSDLPDEFGPLRSLDVVPHNLPVQLTRFVGRDQELAEVDKLLAGTRLLTLTGVGGTGKTRLALQSAAEVSHEFADGVWLVELAPVSDPELVDNALATVIGVREQPGQPLLTTLTDALRAKTTLLMLDNCEHLLGACAVLAETVLQASTDIKVLTTSREALGVPGEVAYAVPSLATPPPDVTNPVEMLRYDAVALFSQRAEVARPDFRLTSENARPVLEVCRRLDGIPLAIELAAARTRALAPAEVAERLDDRFRLLTGGSRTALPRQQTLAAAIAWSYDLLSDEERLLFNRLSVFSGGFTLAAVEAICDVNGLEGGTVLDLVASLVDKSMALAEQTEGGSTRYRLLETLRQYGQERLAESDEIDQLRLRHAEFFTELAEEGEAKLKGPEQLHWFRRLESELDNIRAALAWALDAAEWELYLRLAAAVAYLWQELGYWTEGRSWLSTPPVFDEAQDAGLRARAILGVVNITVPEDPDKAADLAEQVLTMSDQQGDQGLVARALEALGYANMHRYRPRESLEQLEQALAVYRGLDDRWGVATALSGLGNAYGRIDSERSVALLQESLDIFNDLGDQLAAAENLYLLGANANRRGEPQRGGDWLRESLGLHQRLGSRSGEGHDLLELGIAARQLEDWDSATDLLEQGLNVLTSVGDEHCAAIALRNLGLADLDGGEVDEAPERLRPALEMSHRVGDKKNTILSLEAMARLAAEQGDGERGAMLLGAAYALDDDLAMPRSVSEEADRRPMLESVRLQLEEPIFDEEWARGTAMSMDAAVAFALGSLRGSSDVGN